MDRWMDGRVYVYILLAIDFYHGSPIIECETTCMLRPGCDCREIGIIHDCIYM